MTEVLCFRNLSLFLSRKKTSENAKSLKNKEQYLNILINDKNQSAQKMFLERHWWTFQNDSDQKQNHKLSQNI